MNLSTFELACKIKDVATQEIACNVVSKAYKNNNSELLNKYRERIIQILKEQENDTSRNACS